MTKQPPSLMEEVDEQPGSARPFAAGLLIGALMGAGVALLFAPQSGADTRRMIRRRSKKIVAGAQDRYEDVKDRSRKIAAGAQDRFEDVKNRIRHARRKTEESSTDD